MMSTHIQRRLDRMARMQRHLDRMADLDELISQRSCDPATTELYILIQQQNWSRAMVHYQEHPEEASIGHEHWPTPLLAACYGIRMIGNEDFVPAYELFLTTLIGIYPEALLSTHPRTGDLPLHMICRNNGISPELLHKFLMEQPATACQCNKAGLPQTPLALLLQNVPFPRGNEKTFPRSSWTEEVHQIVARFLTKVELLVDAMVICEKQGSVDHPNNTLQGDYPTDSSNNSRDKNNSTRQIMPNKIHAFIALGEMQRSSRVLEYLVEKYPQQLHIRDDSGQLPLHLVLTTHRGSPRHQGASQGAGMIRALLTKYPHAARARLFSKWDDCCHDHKNGNTTSSGTVYGRFPLHIALTSGRRWKEGVQEIYQAAPDMVSVRDSVDGRYPLHIALANRLPWKEGIQELFEAAPAIVCVRDPVTMLYPFQLAAVTYQGKWQLHWEIETIFQLLRQRPDLVML